MALLLTVLVVTVSGCEQQHTDPGEPVRCATGGTQMVNILPNGSEVYCRLDSGVAHGPYAKKDQEDRTLVEGQFDQGRADGEWITYFEDIGAVERRRVYVLDVPDGTWNSYFRTGELQSEQHYDMGVVCGVWRQLSVEGELHSAIDYGQCGGAAGGVDPPDGLAMAPTDLDPGWAGDVCPDGTLETDPAVPGARWCVDGEGRRHGPFGVWDGEDAKQVSGAYEDDARVGTWTIRNDAGQVIRQETYEDGALHGAWASWSASGMPEKSGTYDAGTKTGVWIGWHPRGKRAWEGAYVDGEKDGVWTRWWSDGIIRESSTWSMGRLNGAYALNFEDGRTSRSGSYLDGREEGTWTTYWPNGQVWSEGAYEHGWRQGMWRWWTEDGQPDVEGAYIDQNPVGDWAVYLTDPVLGTRVQLAGAYDGAVRQGLWTGTYVDSGSRESEQVYYDGLMEGAFRAWWPGGGQRVEGTYLASLAEHEWLFWHQNGELLARCNYHQGVRDGACTEWYDTGTKRSEGSYEMGMRVGEWSYWDEDGVESNESFDEWGYPR